MEISAVDVLLFAPLAPLLGVMLFWFIQIIFIESYKYYLSKIKKNHMPLCHFTNFTGILFQTLCHAVGYTATMSGISHFKINIYDGKVKPKKEKKGIFEWISNSFLFIGPFFLPAILLLICLFFLMDSSAFNFSTGTYYSFASGMQVFGSNIYKFSQGFFSFLAAIDLAHPAHLGFLLLLIFLGMGIRPSYIGEDKRRKVDMIYDLSNIKSHIFSKPLYIFLLFLFAYIIFYISLLLNQNWHMALFTIFGWLSIIAIVSLCIAHLIILYIKTTDKIPSYWKFIPALILICSYILSRVIFLFFPTNADKTVSLLIMILSTSIIIVVLLYYKTNTFKTSPKMRQRKVEDGARRIIKK
ncbi:MAG: hypothetical protein R6V50_01965 [Thermoplasmatota archaeon]